MIKEMDSPDVNLSDSVYCTRKNHNMQGIERPGKG